VPLVTTLSGTAQATPPRVRAHLRVLVVEDDPLFRRFVLAALQEARTLSVEAVPVGSLQEAQAALAGGGLDCILLDLGLPDGQGVDTVRGAMAAGPSVPIVVLTGQEDGTVADRMLQAGAQDYLEKAQLEPGSLERALRHAVDRGAWARELADKNRELERRNRDLDDFAHAVSHDLKAPLRAIFHLVRDARGRLDDGELDGARADLDGMAPRIVRLFDMIDGVLRLTEAARSRGAVASVEPAAVAREAVGALVLPAGFTVEVPERMPDVAADRGALSLVFQNLVDNAVKHHDRSHGSVAIHGRADGKVLEITVADDGPGIPEALRERAFLLFQRFNPGVNDSTGIGLALVRKVVEAHGGTIRVEQNEPRGARFVIRWPLAGP